MRLVGLLNDEEGVVEGDGVDGVEMVDVNDGVVGEIVEERVGRCVSVEEVVEGVNEGDEIWDEVLVCVGRGEGWSVGCWEGRGGDEDVGEEFMDEEVGGG